VIYAFADCILDTKRHEVRRAGEIQKVDPQVFTILTYLIQHRDRVVTRRELIDYLWSERFVNESNLTHLLMRVRKAVGDNVYVQQIIKTLHRWGYRFVATVEECEDRVPACTQNMVHTHIHTNSRGYNSEAMLSGARLQPTSGDLLPVRLVGSLLDTFSASPALLEGEHKQVTVLCCSLAETMAPTVRFSPEILQALMQQRFAAVQQVMRFYEGVLIYFLSTGFMALFDGAGGQKNHAQQAVQAALMLLQLLDKQPGPEQASAACIGLHTGIVVVHHFACDPQRFSTVLGKTISFTAQLQHLAAPGTILISETTSRLVQGKISSAVAASDDVVAATPVKVYTEVDLLHS
jgi:DNA-binding winged helix-turn-helix (wHTH) protein